MPSKLSTLAHIDPSAKIGNDVVIHAFAYIDRNTVIGDGCEIMPYASVLRGTILGAGCRIFQGAVVGAEPQDFRWEGGDTACTLGDKVVVREQVIINRGITPGTAGTTIGDETFIMAQCHIGHDTHIKGKCVLGNGVSIAGDVDIDECTILSSYVIVHEGCHLGKWAMVKGGCRIGSNVPPYVIVAHNPVSYYGINATLMRRRGGFSEGDIDNAAKAYRHVYQCHTSVFNALRRIEADIPECDIRADILGFIRDNNLRLVAVPAMVD